MKILSSAALECSQINARKGKPALLKKSGLGIRIEGFSPGAFFPCSHALAGSTRPGKRKK
jgi:hypothetical protein